jgi:hypothetical protein
MQKHLTFEIHQPRTQADRLTDKHMPHTPAQAPAPPHNSSHAGHRPHTRTHLQPAHTTHFPPHERHTTHTQYDTYHELHLSFWNEVNPPTHTRLLILSALFPSVAWMRFRFYWIPLKWQEQAPRWPHNDVSRLEVWRVALGIPPLLPPTLRADTQTAMSFNRIRFLGCRQGPANMHRRTHTHAHAHTHPHTHPHPWPEQVYVLKPNTNPFHLYWRRNWSELKKYSIMVLNSNII